MSISTETDVPGTQPSRPTDDPPNRPQGPRVRNVALGLGAVAAVLALLAVFATGNDTSAPGWRGRVLPTSEPMPDINLTDTEGQPFSLREDTHGELTLVMFGYTNCPDICPISLGTLAASLEDLGPEVHNKVDMVFVSADPERDTPEVLRTYLDGYDRDFTGLRGTPEEVARAQAQANVPRAEIGTPDADGEYAVGHATQIIAYQDDGVARIVYPFGTRSEDWKIDLPRLLDGEIPEP